MCFADFPLIFPFPLPAFIILLRLPLSPPFLPPVSLRDRSVFQSLLSSFPAEQSTTRDSFDNSVDSSYHVLNRSNDFKRSQTLLFFFLFYKIKRIISTGEIYIYVSVDSYVSVWLLK